MDRGRQPPASVLHSPLVRALFVPVLLMACSGSSASAQHNHRPPGDIDPEQLTIAATRERLTQHEKNIAVQQMTLAEFEAKARKIRRQLEALTLMPADAISSRLLEYAAEKHKELKALEGHIETTKRVLADQAQWTETDRREPNAQEDLFTRRIADNRRQFANSPEDEYRDRIEQQNTWLLEEAAQRQRQVAEQNHLLMQEEEPPRSWPERRQVPLLPTGNTFDTDELRLCQLLEKKAVETGYDIAEINLLAAKGLPGAENLDVDRSLKTLDLWAAWVWHETDRHLYKYREAPEEYNSSEAYFRILMMICTLQEDFHVCYNRDPKMRAGPVELAPSDLTFFGNPKDLFVNGLTESTHEGTCASLPVLYVAIGRRLGYPLKLVECKGHLFARWEDDKERFNIEGTNRGLNCYPDREYQEWPYPISKEELATGMYMTSLSPKRELAAFLELRALCLKQNELHERRSTVKIFADGLRKKEGVDLDRLNRLVGESGDGNSISVTGGADPALPYQALTSTNTWRTPGDERGAPGKHTVFATERFGAE